MQAPQPVSIENTVTTPSIQPATDLASSLVRHYHVTSVDKAQAPGGAEGDWYCYVLEGGRSPITGLRRGTLIEVTEHAKRCAQELNERNNGKSPSAWAPRRSRVS
jgi:hypothetical protein